jgi:hypothetical protein
MLTLLPEQAPAMRKLLMFVVRSFLSSRGKRLSMSARMACVTLVLREKPDLMKL